LFVRHQIQHTIHLFATLLSIGLWLIPWLAICIEGAIRPWRCEACGWHKPEFRVPLKEALKMGESAVGRRNPKCDAPVTTVQQPTTR
jgi:hypothetical protein